MTTLEGRPVDPPTKGDARYMALAAEDPSRQFAFRLFPDGSGEGVGPDGVLHRRFRAWKEALRDSGAAQQARPQTL